MIRLPEIGKKVDHKLRKNKKNNVPRYIICLDTEAWIDEHPEGQFQRLRLGWAVFCNLKRGKEKWIEFKSQDEFWRFLISMAKPNSRILVFAHNFDYDFQILGGFKKAFGYGLSLDKMPVFDNKNFIVSFTFRFLRKKTGRPTKCRYVFISTTNYVKTSLENIGKALGIEKLKDKLNIDFDRLNKVPDRVLSKYCKRDVEILLQFVKFLVKFIKHHDLGNFQFTIAKQSFTAFRHRFLKDDIYIHANPLATALERIAYKGGRTEAFFIGKVPGRVFYVDVNSLYPFVMKESSYPVRLINVIKKCSTKRLLKLMRHFLVIAHIKVRTETPCLGIRDERTGKLIFPVGEFEGVFTSPEIKLLLKEGGKILETYEVAIYEGKPIFREYVQFFYDLKKKYKHEKNKAFYLMTKLFLNSLYGKFGQRVEKYEIVGRCTKDDDFFVEQYYDSEKKEWHYRINAFGIIFERSKRLMESFNSFVAIASFVSAYGRCYLYELMKIAGFENVYYCDTDSLFTNEIGFRRLEEAGLIDEYELGKLKLEKVGDNVIIYGVKDYVFEKEVKLKGVKKDAKKIAENKFEQLQFVSTRVNLKQYRLDGVIVKKIQKELKREYEKGIVLQNGRVISLTLCGEKDAFLLDAELIYDELLLGHEKWFDNLMKEVIV